MVFVAMALGRVYAVEPITTRVSNVTLACLEISQKISGASAVLYASMLLLRLSTRLSAKNFRTVDPSFTIDIHHWIGSSSQIPECVVEVGSAEDTGVVVSLDSL